MRCDSLIAPSPTGGPGKLPRQGAVRRSPVLGVRVGYVLLAVSSALLLGSWQRTLAFELMTRPRVCSAGS